MKEEDLKQWVAITASVSTIFQFLAGTLICQKIVQKKSTGDISGFPFISGFISTSLWLRYGFLIHDNSIILVNTIGATLHVAYVITFFYYSIKKSVMVHQFCGCVSLLLLALIYSIYETNIPVVTKYIGFLCCFTSLMFFAAPLVSVMYVIRIKSAESLPFPIIFMSFIVSLQWFIYGVLLKDNFVQVPNFLGCVLSAFQLTLFCIYPKTNETAKYNLVRNF